MTGTLRVPTHSSRRSFFASQKWGLPYQLHSSAQKGPKSASIYLKSWLSHCRRCILNLDTIRNVLLALKKKFGLPYQTPRKCPKGHHKTSMTLKFKLWHCHCCIHNFRNHTKMYTCITARVVFTISGSTRVPKRGPKVPQRGLKCPKGAWIYLKSLSSHCRGCTHNLDTISNVLLALQQKFDLPYQRALQNGLGAQKCPNEPKNHVMAFPMFYKK